MKTLLRAGSILLLSITIPLFFAIKVFAQSPAVVSQNPLEASVVAIEVNTAWGQRLCSGFLLSPRHILTAAQCFFPDNDATEEATPAQVVVRWSMDNGQTSPDLHPTAIQIHPGYRKDPTRQAAWTNRQFQASPFDMALLSFDQTLLNAKRALPMETDPEELKDATPVQVYGFDQGRVKVSDFTIGKDARDRSLARITPDDSKMTKAKSSDFGGPAIVKKPNGQNVVWGIMVSQDNGMFQRANKASVIQLGKHSYWLLNQMQKDLGQFLAEAFATKTVTQQIRCQPTTVKQTKEFKDLPKIGPVPKKNPRKPNAIGMPANLKNLKDAVPSNVHKVVIMGEEADPKSPLLKSIVQIQIPGSQCSGTLITPIHVVTAAHCFEQKNLGAFDIKVFFYKNSRETATYIRAIRYRNHEDYKSYPKNVKGYLDVSNPQFEISSNSDIALVTLDRPAPAPFEPMGILPFGLDLQTDEEIKIAGVGRDSIEDKNSGRKVKFTTMAVTRTPNKTHWKLSPTGKGGAMPGDSGGAALYFDKSGNPFLWGVIIQTSLDEEKRLLHSSEVIPIFGHAPWLYQHIQTDLFDIQTENLKPQINFIRGTQENCIK